ncbi:hypothetical protein PAXRUDRAFT_174420, partial [Paxillus rubicundulus Ve08.2h10]
WTGTHFQECSLRLAGLTLHLGHDGGVCPSRVQDVFQEVPKAEWEPIGLVFLSVCIETQRYIGS